jgi:polyketide cyclase/dehydrase/lipid transport protein
MTTNTHFSVCTDIPAAPARVYHVLSDYRVHHPAILPKDIFSDLRVLSGGQGAGTRFTFQMRLGGRTHPSEMVVTEPAPGRVLIEATTDGKAMTSFTVEPLDAGRATRLTVATDLALPEGFLLPLQRWVTASILKGIYRREMKLLADYLAQDRDLKAAS